jgi:hypothetical protein
MPGIESIGMTVYVSNDHLGLDTLLIWQYLRPEASLWKSCTLLV